MTHLLFIFSLTITLSHFSQITTVMNRPTKRSFGNWALHVYSLRCINERIGNSFMQQEGALAYWVRVCFNSGSRRGGTNCRTGKNAGCEKIFQEKASGGRSDRPALHSLLEQLREGDVWWFESLTACHVLSKTS